ncbi:MAG: radical SAM protein [Thermoguttaceae bacterium]
MSNVAFKKWLQNKDTHRKYVTEYFFPFVGIDVNGRVKVRTIDIFPSHGCNLKCSWCCNMSYLQKGLTPLPEMQAWIDTWQTKVIPEFVAIAGGEPLLHPETDALIYAVREAWEESHIILYTNGILLDEKKTSVLKAIFETNGSVSISKHINTPQHNEAAERAVSLCKSMNVTYNVNDCYEMFKFYEKDSNDCPLPCNSKPELAYGLRGCQKGHCSQLYNNKLYRCGLILSAQMLHEKQLLPDAWRFTRDYHALDANCTAIDILQHYNSGPMPECKICPHKYIYVPVEQLSLCKTVTLQNNPNGE